MNIIPADQLQAKLSLWRRRLNLTDWDITVAIVPMSDLIDEDAERQVEFCLLKKQADIKLITPEEYPKDALRDYDMEVLLVHELLHISMVLFSPNSGVKAVALEQSINAIASALFSLSREAHIADSTVSIQSLQAWGSGESA